MIIYFRINIVTLSILTTNTIVLYSWSILVILYNNICCNLWCWEQKENLNEFEFGKKDYLYTNLLCGDVSFFNARSFSFILFLFSAPYLKFEHEILFLLADWTNFVECMYDRNAKFGHIAAEQGGMIASPDSHLFSDTITNFINSLQMQLWNESTKSRLGTIHWGPISCIYDLHYLRH